MHLAKFVKQKSFEEIQYILHRHPITFLPEVVVAVVLFLIPPGIWIVFGDTLLSDITAGSAGWVFLILLMSAYYITTLTFFYTQFVTYYLDLWVVTNDRIIDVDQKTLFAKTISELGLVNVQDVTTDVTGFFATMFDYGDVIIKTASDNPNIIFRKVHRPNKIRAAVIDLADKDKQRYASGGNV